MTTTKTAKNNSLHNALIRAQEVYTTASRRVHACPTTTDYQRMIMLNDLDTLYYATDVVEVRVQAARLLGGIAMLQAQSKNGEFLSVRDSVLALQEALLACVSLTSQRLSH